MRPLILVLLTTLNSANCLLCLSDFCQNIDGCLLTDDPGKTVRCPADGSCFLQVKLQVDDGIQIITERAQGCATEWHYMESENGSWNCFDGPRDQQKTCVCSGYDLCNRQLTDAKAYHSLELDDFPPPSSRKIECIDSGAIVSDQSYCTYRRSNGTDRQWLRRGHTTGYVTLLENSRRDHLCFQENSETDCYCKTDRCNEMKPQSILGSSFAGAFDEKVTCCRGETEERKLASLTDTHTHPAIKPSYQCSSIDVCKGDYCFVRFKYNVIRRTAILRQTCYNTSSELEFSHSFEGKEYGPYRERVLYCRSDFCNELAVVFRSIGRGTQRCMDLVVVLVLLAICFSVADKTALL